MEDPFYTKIWEKIQAGDISTGSYLSNDGVYMVSMQQVEGTNWYLVTRALEDVIYQDVYKISLILVSGGVVVLALITVILILIINKITKPIRKLTDVIVTVTGGDFTKDIEVKGSDELAKGSNRISGELHESVNGQADAMEQMRQICWR